MLPDGDGFVLARKIKRDYDIPIIFLTARVSESDRITGLELGADDYVIKPFSTKELVLRIKAVIKRTSSKVEKKIINTWGLRGKNDVLEVDVEIHSLRVNGNIVDLTPGEWKILNRLIENPGIVLI
jgi:DNA-binding response OmpR family regulator